MRIAIVGCGFVADYYVSSLALHPELELVGVTDRDEGRTSRFSTFHSVRPYASLDEILVDVRAVGVDGDCAQDGEHDRDEKDGTVLEQLFHYISSMESCIYRKNIISFSLKYVNIEQIRV